MPWPETAMLVGLAAGLWAADRMLRAAEARGWIYWRNKGRSSRAFSAMLSVQSIIEPDKQHVVEERRQQNAKIDVASDDEPLE